MSDEIKKQQAFAWKLRNDRLWYMENFLKIRDKKSQLVPFIVNDAQKQFNKTIEENTKNNKPHRYIILKARQLGMSTFTEGYIYHNTTTRPFVNSLIICHEDKASTNLFNMSKLFYETSPEAIKPMKKHSNGKELVFENPTQETGEKLINPGLRSKIAIATAGANDTARSNTYHNVHVSEIAFFPNPTNTMTALLQCVPDEPNTFVCIESTANGVGGYFYDLWNAAVDGKNDFTPIFFPWFTDKNYSVEFFSKQEKNKFISSVNKTHVDLNGEEVHTEEYYIQKQFNLTYEQLNWRRKTISNKCNGDIDMFRQEYPATPEEAFISSGRPVFNLNSLREYDANCTPPKYTLDLIEKGENITINPHDNGFIQVWKTPTPNEIYFIGADVAEGLVTGDYSVGIVIDSKFNVCAKWRGHIDPDLFGDELVKLGKFYNDAYLAIENNNHGLTTIKSVLRREYYNIFYTKTYDKITDTITKKAGWSTTARTKPYAIDRLAEYIREKFLFLFDKEIISELFTYVRDDKGRTNAQEGKHDDCVMALAITLQAVFDKYGQDYMPEIPRDEISKVITQNNFDIPEIIDPLFESISNEEYT